MKRAAKAAVAALLVLSIASPALALGPVGKRQVRQQKRIYQGVRSGELTPAETVRLEREQMRIERQKRRMLSDGNFTCRERIRIHRMQDRASRHIFRLKHNNRSR